MSTQDTLLNLLTTLNSGEGAGIDGSIYRNLLLRIQRHTLMCIRNCSLSTFHSDSGVDQGSPH